MQSHLKWTGLTDWRANLMDSLSNLVNITQRHIQKSSKIQAVNYFRKTFRLRYLTGFYIHLYYWRNSVLLWTRRKCFSCERSRSMFENFRELKMMSWQSLRNYCSALVFRKGNIIPRLHILMENFQRGFRLLYVQGWYSFSSLSF